MKIQNKNNKFNGMHKYRKAINKKQKNIKIYLKSIS